MPDTEDRKPRSGEPDTANDAVTMAADWVRQYQNHLIALVCLILLVVLGYNWWSKQNATKEGWAWRNLSEGMNTDGLEKAVQQYSSTGAAPYLRFELAKSYQDDGKLDEAEKIYNELQTNGGDQLAAQLARSRLTDLKAERTFLKALPDKLKALADNAQPPEPPTPDPEIGPPRRLMTKPVDPTESKTHLPDAPPSKEVPAVDENSGPPRDATATPPAPKEGPQPPKKDEQGPPR